MGILSSATRDIHPICWRHVSQHHYFVLPTHPTSQLGRMNHCSRELDNQRFGMAGLSSHFLAELRYPKPIRLMHLPASPSTPRAASPVLRAQTIVHRRQSGDAFYFIGTQDFHHVAGELRYEIIDQKAQRTI